MDLRRNGLGSTARVMLKLGCLAFGGPSAHIALLEDEVVERRQWMTRQHFLDLVGATSLIPGPNSTEMMMHVGFERGRWPGLVVAGLLFVLPAALITGLLAALYVGYGSLPQIEPLLWGVKPAVLVVIVGAVWRLGRSALKTWREMLLAAGVALAVVLGINELMALFFGALLGTVWLLAVRGQLHTGEFQLLLFLASSETARQSTSAGVDTDTVSVTLGALGLFFLKVGAVLYGSGYLLVAFLESDLVERLGWLTREQLLDAIAVGQMTPGPVLSTATFIGFLLMGVPGAMVATLAIFLPSFVFVGLLNPIVPKLRKRTSTAAFLDAVNCAALALMAAVVVKLGIATLTSWRGWLVALLAAVALFGLRLHSAWLILGGALLGYLFELTPLVPGLR